MPSYDSIVVGEDWISEHYFTTDSTKESFQGKVLELRKQWDAEAAEDRDTVRRHLLVAAGELQTALSTLDEHPEGAAYAHALTRRTLGFTEELTEYTGVQHIARVIDAGIVERSTRHRWCAAKDVRPGARTGTDQIIGSTRALTHRLIGHADLLEVGTNLGIVDRLGPLDNLAEVEAVLSVQ